MGRKKPAIKRKAPVELSEEEIEEEEEEQVEGGEQNGAVEEDKEHEEEQQQQTPVKKSAANPSSDDDSDSDTDTTDTQPSPSASAFTIKPRDNLAAAASKKTVSSKRKAKEDPMVEETKSKINGNGKKKSKRATGSTGRGGAERGGGKRGTGISQRLWSVDDEIALLKGTCEYRRIQGSDPSKDDGYHEFIKKSCNLSFDISKAQLADKIYRLKKKYKINVEKAGDDDPVFTKPHEETAFDLSKKIWGHETLKAKQAKRPVGVTLALPNRKNPIFSPEKKVTGEEIANCEADVGAEADAEAQTQAQAEAEAEVLGEKKNCGNVESGFCTKFPRMSLSLDLEMILGLPEFGKNFIGERMSLCGSDKAKELEVKWRDLQEKELELHLKRIDLVKLQAQLALDVMRASRP